MYKGELEGDLPEPVNRFAAECTRADAMPEYKRSLPAVLKNAIDWGSKPTDKNVRRDKPVASAVTTPGAIGTAPVQLHLRQIMGALSSSVMGGECYLSFKPELIADAESVHDESVVRFLQTYMERFACFVAKLALRSRLLNCRFHGTSA